MEKRSFPFLFVCDAGSRTQGLVQAGQALNDTLTLQEVFSASWISWEQGKWLVWGVSG